MSIRKAGISAKLDKIQVLDGVRAIAPGRATADGLNEAASTIAAEHAVDAREATAFEEAGWRFVKAGRADVSEADHDVVVDSDGHLKILGRALNVKFDPTLSRSEITRILDRFGLSIRRSMGFAPNLFLVSGNSGDILSKAEALNKLDGVVYAEPVMFEALERR